MTEDKRQPRVLGQRKDPPLPSEYVLGRYGARLVNPIRSPRSAQEQLRPTAYVADRLLVPAGEDGERALTLLRSVADDVELVPEPCHLFREGGHDVDPAGQHYAKAYRLRPKGKAPVAPDAWLLLEKAWATGDSDARLVTLDHLMFGPAISGTIPHTSGHGTGGGLALASYGEVGSGGRQVVSWVGRAPLRDENRPAGKRPRVALLDTGCGEHPWLKDGVTRFRVGSQSDTDDPEKYADQDSPLLGELDSHSGHGTFSAGLIRQGCPDADVLSIRVMGSDGVVKEWETLHALQALLGQMRRWLDGHDDAERVDVVVMSLGYYHETPLDPAYTALLSGVLEGFGRLGVVVIAAAGNDATNREFYPAALSPDTDVVHGRDRDRVPVIAVGSLNPDGQTVALFNNHGPWIREWRPGVSLVSTVPRTMSGALQPRLELGNKLTDEPGPRATIDDDDFRGGFAVWSGTSFAAPVLAADIAEAMVALDDAVDWPRDRWLERGWEAVEHATRIRRAGDE